MKRLPVLMAVVGLLLFASSAFGQNTTLHFNGNTQGDVYCQPGGPCVYTGYYDGSINGMQVGPGQPAGPGMICDDWNHEIYSGESWTATGVAASSLLTTGTGALQYASIGITGYTELAYLVWQMFNTKPSSPELSAYSQALWYITGGLTQSQISAQAWTYVQNAVNFFTAGGNLSNSMFANLWIYTPVPGGTSGPQEMWGEVAVPEGGAALMYLLLAGVSCFGAMFLRSRNQGANPGMA